MGEEDDCQWMNDSRSFTIYPMQKQLIPEPGYATLHGSSVVLRKIHIEILVLGLLVVAAIPILYTWLPPGDDWPLAFRSATLILLHGQSPYTAGIGFYNPPWALLPLIPITLLPFQLGRLVLFLVSLAAFAYSAHKLTSHPISIILFITSMPVVFCLLAGNLDWMVMVAFITPAPFALILAAIKPQVGVGIAFYWLLESWRQGGIGLVIKNFTPVGLLLVASFLLYGFYPLSFSELDHAAWNAAPFPYLIPFGIFVLASIVRSQENRYLMATGLFFSPYFGVPSLFVFLVPFLERPKVLFVAWVLLWIMILAKAIIR